MELHARNEISQLFPTSDSHRNADSLEDLKRVSLYGIDFYPRTGESKIPALLNRGYHYLIFDMGSFTETAFPELLRCDRKLVLGSLAPWKAGSYQDFFAYNYDTSNLMEGFYYLMQTGNAKELLQFSKTYHIPRRNIVPIPFIKNPFCIEKESFLFFQELLSE